MLPIKTAKSTIAILHYCLWLDFFFHLYNLGELQYPTKKNYSAAF